MARSRSGADAPALSAPEASGNTTLGMNTRFTGTLRSEGSVHLEDIFEGDLFARERVTLGKHASLDGSLVCDVAVIAGLVHGSVTARKVAILSTGRVLGELRMEQLMTEDGSYMEGVITLEESLDLDALLNGTPAGEEEHPPAEAAEREGEPAP